MTVAGNRVYTQGNGTVCCLDVETGGTLWRWPEEGEAAVKRPQRRPSPAG